MSKAPPPPFPPPTEVPTLGYPSPPPAKPKPYCCESMERWSQPCENHRDDPMKCPDRLIHRTAKAQLAGIRLFDGSNAFVVIAFCPWCGTDLGQRTGPVGARLTEVE